MIERLRVRNYKALRNVGVSLGPINLLIGPNDSGKTSFLEAIGAMCRSADEVLSSAFAGSWSGLDLVSDRDPERAVELEVALGPAERRIEYGFSCTFRPHQRHTMIQTEWVSSDGGPRKDLTARSHSETLVKRVAADHENADFVESGKVDAEIRALMKRIHRELHGVQSLHLDPRMLALPVAPDSTRSFRLDSSGFGLARCLDEILGVDRERFARIETGLRAIFPDFKSIRLEPQSAFRAPPDVTRDVPQIQVADGKGIELTFDGGIAPVPAPQVSDGVLMLIAYLTVLNLPTPPRLLLVEEPENGVHPRRLQEVLGLFREFVKAQPETQVVMTSHSPYIVDLFQPEEVYACTLRRDQGVSITPLSESAVVRAQIRHFTLGEIWSAEGEEVLAVREASGDPPAR